jgi:hypothetical protein
MVADALDVAADRRCAGSQVSALRGACATSGPG